MLTKSLRLSAELHALAFFRVLVSGDAWQAPVGGRYGRVSLRMSADATLGSAGARLHEPHRSRRRYGGVEECGPAAGALFVRSERGASGGHSGARGSLQPSNLCCTGCRFSLSVARTLDPLSVHQPPTRASRLRAEWHRTRACATARRLRQRTDSTRRGSKRQSVCYAAIL